MISYDPPMSDANIPPNENWGHIYTATVDDPETMPAVTVTGASANLVPDTKVIPTDDPLVYKVIVNFKSDTAVSTENIEINFQQVPVNVIEEPIDINAKPYPNPFTNSTTIDYELNDARDVSIEVYNLQGQLIRQLYEGSQGPGKHTVTWDGSNGSGSDLPSGLYLMTLNSEGYQPQVLKLMKGSE